MAYFNTNNLTGDQLKLFQKQAKTQEDRIFAFLVQRPNHWFAPHAIQMLAFQHRRTPITSVRRALTNLEHKGKIVRSPLANAIGEYGHPVHTYCYKGDV